MKYVSINKLLKFTMLSILPLSVILSCQHGRVQLAARYPDTCKKNQEEIRNAKQDESTEKLRELENQCQEDLQKVKNEDFASDRITSHTMKQEFYIGGIYPFDYKIDLAELCPGQSLLEVYQYATWKDGLYEQLTLGIYSPRTLEIKCIKPKPKPKPKIIRYVN